MEGLPLDLLESQGTADWGWYAQQHELAGDVQARLHFADEGVRRGLSPHPFFDCAYYRQSYLPPGGGHPILDFSRRLDAGDFRRKPNLFFDLQWYRKQHRELSETWRNPFQAFCQAGLDFGHSPSPYFGPDVSGHLFGPKDLPRSQRLQSLLARSQGAARLDEDHVAGCHAAVFPKEPDLPGGFAFHLGVVVYGNSREQIARLRRSIAAELAASPQLEAAFAGLLIRDQSDVPLEFDISGSPETDLMHGENAGFGAGHNLMMRQAFAAGSDIYICVNPDGFFLNGCLRTLVMAAAANRDALVEALQFPDEMPKVYDPYSFETGWCAGACLALSREIFERTGGFDERFFLYCEDVDLSWRARAQGFRCLICPDARFYHDKSGRGEEDDWRRVAMLRSGAALAAKWHGRDFYDYCRRELRTRGEQAARFDDGAWANLAELDGEGQSPADFEHRFSFAPVRW